MAAIEQLFRAHLAGNAGVAALVGTRIYPERAPQDAAAPYITFQGISRAEHIYKPNSATLHLVRERIQVDGYAKGTSAYSATRSLKAAIISAAYGFNRDANSAVVETRVVDAVDGQEADEGFYRVSIDVSILFNE